MEHQLGSDFSDVRIHRGSEAAASAQAFGSRAYTVGNHIVFAPSRYDPASAKGQHTLAHELAHVIQQRRGPVSGLSVGDDVTVSQPDDSFERAAQDTAREIVAGLDTLRPGDVTPGSDGGGTRATPFNVQNASATDDGQLVSGDSTPVADGGALVTDGAESPMALQRSAGNRAVASQLGMTRHRGVTVQRDSDGEQPDVGQPDVGQPDVGQPDVGQPDVGQPDVGAEAATIATGWYGLITPFLDSGLEFSNYDAPPRVVVSSKMLNIIGTYIVDTGIDTTNYDVGFVQTLVAEQPLSAEYVDADGRVVQILTIQTQPVPIRDSVEGLQPWYQEGGKPIGPAGNFALSCRDRPQYGLPWKTPDGPPGSLSTASGQDSFCTWLVARDRQTGTTVYLAWITWSVDWGSQFKSGDESAVSTGAGGQLLQQGEGQGPLEPVLDGPVAKDRSGITWSVAP
jgi:hypothetical protein